MNQSEIRELAQQFEGDVLRMMGCLEKAGHLVTVDEVVLTWSAYSETLRAGWLLLPPDDERLLQILVPRLPSQSKDNN